MTYHRPPTCDCTTWCGGDPDVQQGKAFPCGSYRRSRLLQRRADMAAKLLKELGYRDYLSALRALRRLSKEVQ